MYIGTAEGCRPDGGSVKHIPAVTECSWSSIITDTDRISATIFELIDGTSVYKLLEKENPLYLDTIDTALTAPHRFWVKHSCTHRNTDTVYLQKFGINAD